MKTFFGETFIDKLKLKEANIYNPIKLEYYKVENEAINKEKYGIEIIKREYKQDKILIEDKTFNGVTNDEILINKVLNIFKSNEVTPISAKDIIHDLLYY